MEQTQKNQAEEIKSNIEKLQDVLDVLIGFEPKNPDAWDDAILRAIREVNEVKCYFKNQL
jgi:hypothetical protein